MLREYDCPQGFLGFKLQVKMISVVISILLCVVMKNDVVDVVFVD